jgi:hypothetical protein
MTDEKERGDRQWFEERIGRQLERLDETFAPRHPELSAMESFVAESKRELKRKFRRELILFWLSAVFVIGGMVWTLDKSLALFVALQALVTLAAAGWLTLTLLRSPGRGRKQWENG